MKKKKQKTHADTGQFQCYKCRECGKRITHDSYLTKHIIKVHASIYYFFPSNKNVSTSFLVARDVQKDTKEDTNNPKQ